jgi:Tol biopolymer transport system component
VISAIGGTVRQLLAGGAYNAELSPDESRIAYEAGGGIRVMGANGESPRELVPIEKGVAVNKPQWSPDGRRVAYLRFRTTPREAAIESRDAAGGPPTVILSLPRRGDYCWLRDGRILYVLAEPPPNEASENLWQLRVDTRTGKAAGQARRYTNWLGSGFKALSASDDGKRLAYMRGLSQSDVWVGQLQTNSKWSREPWKLTLDERADWPGGWTPDSRYLLFFSDRNGAYDIFRHAVDGKNSEPMLTSSEEKRAPQASPDGTWILYWSWPRSPEGGRPGAGRLMRAPMAGGAPQTVMEIKDYPGPIENYGNGVSRGNPSFRCPSRPGASCVLAEPDGTKLVFSALDPLEGRKQAIAGIEMTKPKQTAWDLSPDGSRIVVQLSQNGEPCLHRILKTSGETERDVAVEKTINCLLVAWSANGRSLFVTRHALQAHTLMHVTLDGKATELRQSPTWFDLPKPSPDGRYLAFADTSSYNNAWLIEDIGR